MTRGAPDRPPGASLDGIDLVVFDKDGTLIDFDRMWSGWSAELVAKVAQATDPALAGRLGDALGLDRASGRVVPGGPLSATPMGHLRALTIATLREAGLTSEAAETAVARSWDPPDPVALAHPLTDLVALFGRLRGSGRRIGVVTSDDRGPTEATLAGLGVAGLVDAIVCADDGLPVKPAPNALLHVGRQVGIAADRTAMIGDSRADLAMGRAAGARLVVGVLSGVGDRRELERDADLILPSIADLMG